MVINVKVKPGSSRGPRIVVLDIPGGEPLYTVFLRERPVEGQANAALAKVLAQHFGIAPSLVHIRHGHRSQIKQVWIDVASEV